MSKLSIQCLSLIEKIASFTAELVALPKAIILISVDEDQPAVAVFEIELVLSCIVIA